MDKTIFKKITASENEAKLIVSVRSLNQESMQVDLTSMKGPADTVSMPDVFQYSPMSLVNSSEGRALKC